MLNIQKVQYCCEDNNIKHVRTRRFTYTQTFTNSHITRTSHTHTHSHTQSRRDSLCLRREQCSPKIWYIRKKNSFSEVDMCKLWCKQCVKNNYRISQHKVLALKSRVSTVAGVCRPTTFRSECVDLFVLVL